MFQQNASFVLDDMLDSDNIILVKSFRNDIAHVVDNERIKRAGIVAEHEYERSEVWQCPICVRNPPRSRWSRLNLTFHQKGHAALKMHMLLHRFESLRRQLVCDAIKTEERTMRRKCEEAMQCGFFVIVCEDYAFKLLQRHGMFVHELRVDCLKRIAQGWHKKSQEISQEWTEIIDMHLTNADRHHLCLEEEHSRGLLEMECDFSAVFKYTFVGSPNAHVAFTVIYGEMVQVPEGELSPTSFSSAATDNHQRSHHLHVHHSSAGTSCWSSTLDGPTTRRRRRASSIFFPEREILLTMRGHLERRFQRHASIVTEEERVCDSFQSRMDVECMLPRGINRFNIEQLLTDENMDDESSFLPIPRPVPDADERSPLLGGKGKGKGKSGALSFLRNIGAEELYDKQERELHEMEQQELKQARASLRKKVRALESSEIAHRHQIEATELERRQRAALSMSNVYGVDRRLLSARGDPRFSIKIQQLLKGEKAQRTNLHDVEQLWRQRFERLRQQWYFGNRLLPSRTPSPDAGAGQEQVQKQTTRNPTAAFLVPTRPTSARGGAGARRASSRSPPPPPPTTTTTRDATSVLNANNTNINTTTTTTNMMMRRVSLYDQDAMAILTAYPNHFAEMERQVEFMVELVLSRKQSLMQQLKLLHFGDEAAALRQYEQQRASVAPKATTATTTTARNSAGKPIRMNTNSNNNAAHVGSRTPTPPPPPSSSSQLVAHSHNKTALSPLSHHHHHQNHYGRGGGGPGAFSRSARFSYQA